MIMTDTELLTGIYNQLNLISAIGLGFVLWIVLKAVYSLFNFLIGKV